MKRRDFLIGATAIVAGAALPAVTSGSSIYSQRYEFVSYARGFLVDHEKMPDESWSAVAQAMQRDRYRVAADVFNKAFGT